MAHFYDCSYFQGEMTSVIFANNHWYLFCRLHQILCHRLYQIYEQAVRIAEEEAKCKRERKESTAIALRLKSPSKNPEYFYIYSSCIAIVRYS